MDFLPNVKYDPIVGLGYDYSSRNNNHSEKCSRCGASFFTKEQKILSKWDNLPPQIKENFGYSAIAKGVLKSGDGLMTAIKKEHFGFYEYEGANYHASFTISKPLK